MKRAIEKANIDNKSVENCVCVLRNLSYRAQEIEDPNYDKKQMPVQDAAKPGSKSGENMGCFGASGKGKKKDAQALPPSQTATLTRGQRTGPNKGMDLLWQSEVHLKSSKTTPKHFVSSFTIP